MNEFLSLLSSYPIILFLFSSTVLLIVVTLLLLIIAAFIQGREIIFWPPKFGALANKNASWNTVSEKEYESSSVVKLQTRSDILAPLEQRFKNAQNIFLFGINLVGLINAYEGLISEKCDSGTNLKILVTNPCFFADYKNMPTSWQGSPRRVEDLNSSIRKIEHLQQRYRNIELRLVPFPPPFTMIGIDPDSAKGEIQVEFYTYKPENNSRPHFILENNKQKRWYDFYYNEFQLAWNTSEKR